MIQQTCMRTTLANGRVFQMYFYVSEKRMVCDGLTPGNPPLIRSLVRYFVSGQRGWS